MRIRHSLKAFVPFILMLAAGRSVQAQSGPPVQFGPPVPPSGMPQGMVPQGFQQYPTESPYQTLFEQNYNSDGLWFRDSNNGFGAFSHPRDFFLNVEYTRSKTRDMRGTFGNPTVQSYRQQNDPENDEIIPGLAFYNYFNAANAGMIAPMINNGMRVSGGFWNADGTGLLVDASWVSEADSVFDARRTALTGRLDTSTILALRSAGGTTIPVGAGFNLNGQTDLGITVNDILGIGVPFDEADATQYGVFGTTSEVLDRTLLNLYGLPIYDGRALGDPGSSSVPGSANTGMGVTVPYDIQFLMEHSLSTLGSSMDGAFAPFYERDGVKINPIVGGRFYRINEGFRFRGIDSGLAYGVNNGDNDTPDNAKVFPVGNGEDDDDDFVTDNPAEGGGTAGTITFAQINPSDPVLVRAYLNSQVVSNMAGPEFGMHYTLGERRDFSIVGFTKLAAMFNNEKITIKGDNIFNHMNVDDPTTPTVLLDGFDTNNLNGASANAFTDTDSSVHLSPLFEQSLTAEIPIFSNVPVLRNVQSLEDAKLRLGWTFVAVGEVADPNQSINYTSNPQLGLFPTVNVNRDSFYQNTFSIGVNWNY